MSPETEKIIILSLNKTWNIIAEDCLRALEEAGKEGVMSRDHVTETVCDSSYLETYCKNDIEKDAIREFRKLKYGGKEFTKIIKKAFPHNAYGW